MGHWYPAGMSKIFVGHPTVPGLPILPTKVRMGFVNYTLPFQRDRPVMQRLMGPLPPEGDVDDYFARLFVWAPDSSRIAYIADQDTNDTDELYTSLPDGSNNVKVNGAFVSDGNILSFKWAPDSSRIAYVADQDTDEKDELLYFRARRIE